MLPYCQQFCNIFPTSSPSVWQRAWATWRPLSPTSRARIRRWLQTACRTPRRLSVRRPLLHVTRTHPPTPHAAARTWWTPRSVSVCHLHGPHTTPSAARARQSCCGSRCPKLLRGNRLGAHGHSAFGVACLYGRGPLVPVGDIPLQSTSWIPFHICGVNSTVSGKSHLSKQPYGLDAT